MLHFLLIDPSRWERLRNDRTLIPNVVEETLRYTRRCTRVPRMTVADVEMARIKVPAKTLVCNAIGHANRDPARSSSVLTSGTWTGPPRATAPTRRSGLGSTSASARRWLGLEAAIVLEMLIDRIPQDLTLADDYDYRPHGPLMMRNIKAMPVTFATAAPR